MRGFGEPGHNVDVEEQQCRVCDKWHTEVGDFCSEECETDAMVQSMSEDGEDD